jgi:antitoxin VapB
MALITYDEEVDRLAAELAIRLNLPITSAVRLALQESLATLVTPNVDPRMAAKLAYQTAYMEQHVWSKIPPEHRGKAISPEEQDEILGYGPEGHCN